MKGGCSSKSRVHAIQRSPAQGKEQSSSKGVDVVSRAIQLTKSSAVQHQAKSNPAQVQSRTDEGNPASKEEQSSSYQRGAVVSVVRPITCKNSGAGRQEEK